MFSDDFRIEKGVFSEVPTSQKHCKNNLHQNSHFQFVQSFYGFRHLLGPHFGGLEVLRVHFHDSWRYLRLLEIPMNSNVLSDTPRIQSIQSGEGKMFIPRAHYYRQLGGYSIQNTTHSMKHCHTGSEDVNVRCKCKCKWCMNHMPRSLMAPGKQGPADIY